MHTFGEWLRVQRTTRKLTREEFASRVGCSVAMLRKIEDGERHPSAQVAGLIANCLDIPMEERGTFVRVARGELTTDRLPPLSKLIHPPNLSPAPAVPRVNLPAVPTPLIGRRQEVDSLIGLLADPHCRMLTLFGPGGIGKTRLAIEAASQCRDEFPDGVYFVPLAPITAARFLVPVIAESIGFTFQGELDPKSQLLHYIEGKQALLLMDNIEHLLDDPAVTELFVELLARAGRLKLLATSRAALGLQSESVLEVHGLPIPESQEAAGTSVELFLQRTRRAYAGFNATSEDFPAILRICRLVDGTPLGIELAAAWVRTLSCDEIAREIERGLDFLSVSAKDLPARHRSMRAVFDHSWRLLSEEEQNVLMRLSVFQGGYSREAAQEVAGAILPTLSALVTKSLVRRSGAGRYDLHELIRQYAAEQLAGLPKIRRETEARHGHYFLKFLGQEDLRLRGPAQRESLAMLTADIDNLRSALEWALARKEFARIGTALRAYSTLYDALGWAQEGLEYLGRVKEGLEAKPPRSRAEQIALAHILTSRSLFALRTAQHEQARLMLERSLEILRHVRAPDVRVEAVTFLGIIRIIMGDLPGASELFREGLSLAREIDDAWYEALCLTELAGVDMLLGKLENILEGFQSAVDAWHKTGDLRFTAFGLTSLGMGAMAVGNYEAARAALEESIAINHSVGDRTGLANAYRALGLVAQAQGEHVQALDSLRQSLHMFTDLGARWDVARLLSELGRSAFALGDDSEAERLWCDSLQLALETHGMLTALDVIVELAGLRVKRGDYPRALQLLLMCIDHPATVHETRVRAGELIAVLKEKITPEEFEAVQASSKEITFEASLIHLLE